MTHAKVLAALIPLSMPAISRLLARDDGRYAYKVHFSLFVFMADVEDLKVEPSAVLAVVDAATAYLRTVRVSTARASWMAAHLLGGHIRHPSARRSLHALTVSARWAEGRSAAVAGLGEWLRDRSKRQFLTHRDLLGRIAASDRSEQVRTSARVALMLSSKE